MKLQHDFHPQTLPLVLIAAMILTRYHHFGDALHSPDASLAVFFFAGWYPQNRLFVFLLALAGLIDYVAIANGTSAWCVSPAYVFLIPTYAVLWLAGNFTATLATRKLSRITNAVSTACLLALATTIAFGISNGSFYLFSGRFGDLSWLEYFSRVAKYYPPYLSSTLIYGFAGYAVVEWLKILMSTQVINDRVS